MYSPEDPLSKSHMERIKAVMLSPTPQADVVQRVSAKWDLCNDIVFSMNKGFFFFQMK